MLSKNSDNHWNNFQQNCFLLYQNSELIYLFVISQMKTMNRKTMKILSGDASKVERMKKQERNLTWMGITIVIVFVICNSLYVIYHILKSAGILSTFDKLYLHSTARFFAIMNSSVNIIIYCYFNTRFRETLVSLFRPAKLRNTEKQNSSARPISFRPNQQLCKQIISTHSKARANLNKSKMSCFLLPQHQSTYPRPPESASIEIPPFRPKFTQ